MRPSPGEVTLGIRGWPERAATPLAHVLYIPLSPPRIFYAWSFIRPRRQLTEQYTEGLHWGVPARGEVLYTGQPRPCIEHKGPPSRRAFPSVKRMHPGEWLSDLRYVDGRATTSMLIL